MACKKMLWTVWLKVSCTETFVLFYVCKLAHELAAVGVRRQDVRSRLEYWPDDDVNGLVTSMIVCLVMKLWVPSQDKKLIMVHSHQFSWIPRFSCMHLEEGNLFFYLTYLGT
jgi:hypothetical protein